MIATVTYVAIVVSLIVAIYRRPSVAVAAALCMFGLEQWAQAMVPFFTQHSAFTNIVSGTLVVFGVALVLFRQRGISLNYSATGWLVLILFFYAFTSLLWTPDFEKALSVWWERLPYLVTLLVLAPLLINDLSDVKAVGWSVLLLGGALVIVILIFGEWHGRKIVLAGAVTDKGGNPLAVAEMAGYVAFAAIFLPVMKPAVIHRVLRWLLVGACLVLAVKSGSRGQSLGILITAVSFLLFTLPSKSAPHAFWTAAGIVTVLILGGWALTHFAESDRWTSEGLEESGAHRSTNAEIMLTHWYSSPEVLFFGLGNSAAYDHRLVGYYPHVVPVEIVTEEGLIGCGLFVAILYLATRGLIRVYRIVKHDESNRGMVLTLGAWFAYLLLLAFKQGSMLGTLNLFLFATMLNKYENIVTAGVILKPKALSASWAWK